MTPFAAKKKINVDLTSSEATCRLTELETSNAHLDQVPVKQSMAFNDLKEARINNGNQDDKRDDLEKLQLSL